MSAEPCELCCGDRFVSEHSRSIKGEERRQKTWQLTEEGRELARARSEELSNVKVLLRDCSGTLLELKQKKP